MGSLDDSPERKSKTKNWLLILTAVIPVWGVVLFVGWFVISTLVPVLGPGQTDQLTADKPEPEKAVVDFTTAAGNNDETAK